MAFSNLLRKTGQRVAFGALLIATMSASSIFAQAATMTPVSSQEQLAFEASNAVCLMEMNGTNIRCVTNDGSNENPVFSPDGSRLAFLSNQFGHYSLFVADTDTLTISRLTNDTADNEYPTWSPDGKMIAYTSGRDGLYSELYVMNADGSNPQMLTHLHGYVSSPSFSPDGTRSVFVWDDGSSTNIDLINADGSNLHALTNDQAYDDHPRWSPDGRQIAFESNRDPNSSLGIYVMDSDGANQRQFLDGLNTGSFPIWSPDGSKIMFIRGFGTSVTVCVMNSDGTQIRQITDPALGVIGVPAWSPDGTQIAFSAGSKGGGIYVMDADGTHLRAITNNLGNLFPVWRP